MSSTLLLKSLEEVHRAQNQQKLELLLFPPVFSVEGKMEHPLMFAPRQRLRQRQQNLWEENKMYFGESREGILIHL